jgi:beta-lactamase regulating signal transducer with metallopeptidase domain
MTHLGLSPDLAGPLCGALLHFLWQGLALAFLLSAALSVVRRAAVRYVLAVATLVLMLAAPAATFLVLHHSAPGSGARPVAVLAEREGLRASSSPAGEREHEFQPSADQRSGSPALPEGTEVWLLEFWLAGVIILSVRAFGGLCLLERLRRRETSLVSAELEAMARALERRLGLRRAIRYCQCRMLDAPAVIGWLRPVVLLPVSGLTGLSPEQIAAVVAHELAHIRRHDAFVNLFQTGAETLLFYQPAVWWVSGQIRAEREHCCDDVAVSVCGGVPDYARALMLMEEWRRAPQLAMAANGSRLRSRVLRLLGMETQHNRARSLGFAAASLCLAFVLLAGTGLLGTSRNLFDMAAGLPMARSGMALERTQAGRVARPRGSAPASATGLAGLAEAGPQSAKSTPAPSTGDSAGDQEPAPQKEKESFITGLNSVGLKNLTADQLIGLKVQGVTPDYVRQLRAAGLNPTVDELIGMKVQGVTPDYISAMHALGVDLTPDEAIGMRVQGVTPEYIRALRAEGVEPKPDELIGLRVQGVTPEYIHAMHAAGLKPGPDELIGMKVQGVTPEYVREMQAAGLHATVDQFIGLRVQGVTLEFVRALGAAGLGRLDIDDYITAKTMGITPEFIEKARKHGIRDLTLEKLIGLKQAGVF